MTTKNSSPTVVTIEVKTESFGGFTTLLQGGFFLDIRQGTSIGELLESLPGFSHDYIQEKVETIFLDGLPADDLAQPLLNDETVLAISSAMPGLAGAIFRKNSVHASLRTHPQIISPKSQTSLKQIQVRLKLFNTIAVEKGEQILNEGCTIMASTLKRFLNYRQVLTSCIKKIKVNGEEITLSKLSILLDGHERITLTVTGGQDK